MSEDIKQRIKEIIAGILKIDEAKVTDDANFVDDLGADSLSRVEITMELETEYDCEISDEEAEKITNLAQAAEFINAKTKEKI
jgi:acyl carrier protein